MAEAIRSIAVAEATYHRWRNEFGGLKFEQVRRLKELEDGRPFRIRRTCIGLVEVPMPDRAMSGMLPLGVREREPIHES
jgi:hypothetical protein